MSYKFDDGYKNCPIDPKCEPREFKTCYICSLVHMQDVQMFMLRLVQFPWSIKKGGSGDGKKEDAR